MKKIISVFIMLALLLTFCSCGCEHEWIEATCSSPKTCAKCNATEGEALGHDWKEATCTDPKTCSRCGETSGTALGHTTGLGTCSRCNQIVLELEDIDKSISDYSLKAVNTITQAQKALNTQLEILDLTGDAYYYTAKFKTVLSYLDSANSYLSNAYDKCGEHKEFAEFKSKIKSESDEISRLKNIPFPTTAESYLSFVESFNSFMKKDIEFGKYLKSHYTKMADLLRSTIDN